MNSLCAAPKQQTSGGSWYPFNSAVERGGECAVARGVSLALMEKGEKCIGKGLSLGRKGVGLTGRGWKEQRDAMAEKPLRRCACVVLLSFLSLAV